MIHNTRCSHRKFRWYGQLWTIQRTDYGPEFPRIRAAIAASQKAHLDPRLYMRICLECDDLRRY